MNARTSSQAASGPVHFVALGDLHGRFRLAQRLVETTAAMAPSGCRFVLQVGDLEAHRHRDDLRSMYVPFKRKRLGQFGAYHRGEQSWPLPMYCIGGNHESYAHLMTEGGELAPDIHFLGLAGVREIQGLRVAYLSGVYDQAYFALGPRALPPGPIHDDDHPAQRSLACFRAAEIEALQGGPRPDVLIVHEWPRGLVRREDHEDGTPHHRHLRFGETGSEIIALLVRSLRPRLLLCGHMHRRYAGQLEHAGGGRTLVHCLGNVGGTEQASLGVVKNEEGIDVFA